MSKKKIAIICTSFALSAAVAIGGTLALLTYTTDTKTNVFTIGHDLTGTLTEPSWDPSNAVHVVPNMSIPKDPTVENTSTDQDAFVAIKLDCKTFLKDDQGAETNVDQELAAYTTLFGSNGFATLDLSSDWEQSSQDPTVFYYNKILPYGETVSSPVFQHVNIKATTTYNQLKNFTIKVTAYLVQTDTLNDPNNSTVTNAKKALYTGFSSILPNA